MPEDQSLIAAKELFKLLSGGSPTSDEFSHSFDEMRPYEDFWSNHSNTTFLAYLTELCQHFDIDASRMQQFIEAIADCYYCGEHTAKVQKMPDDEHVCEKCLKEKKEA